MATPHLKSSARGQSILWRGLRPELVRSNPVPLSPDANILVTHDAPDWRQQRDDVLEATRRLVNEVRSICHTESFFLWTMFLDDHLAMLLSIFLATGSDIHSKSRWDSFDTVTQPRSIPRELVTCISDARIPLCSFSVPHPLSTGPRTEFQRQVIPRFAEELCRKDLGSVDGTSGYGFSLTADMHRRGIGMRHMGLLRDMFWRPLHGNVDLSFNSNRARTRTDMRLQLRRGDQVSDTRFASESSSLEYAIWLFVIQELLAFHTRYPEMQKNATIIQLGLPCTVSPPPPPRAKLGMGVTFRQSEMQRS